MSELRKEILLYLVSTFLLALFFALTQWALLVSIERGDLQSTAQYGVKEKAITGGKPDLIIHQVSLRDVIASARWLERLLLVLIAFLAISAMVRMPEPSFVRNAKSVRYPSFFRKLLWWWPEPNHNIPVFLLPLIYLLTGLSLVTLYRLCPALVAGKPVNQNQVYLTMFERQVQFIIIGILAAAVVYIILSHPIWMRRLKSLNWWIPAILNIVLILITIKFGVTINYRRLWIRLGPLTLQTIELGKIFMLIFLVNYFYRLRLFGWIIGWAKEKKRRRIYWWIRHQSYGLLFYLIGLIPVIYQRDFGPILLLACLYIALSYSWSCEFRTPLFMIVMFLGLCVMLYHFGWPSVLVTRMELFMDPWHSVQGRVDSSQLANALWAFSSAGASGAGLGVGLPHKVQAVYAEFILAAIAEETGIVGAVFVLALFLCMLYGIFLAARNTASYEGFLGIGIMLLFGFQAAIILGGITGAIFLAGITMPFMSYGGSSVFSSFILIGMVLALRERRQG